MPQRKLKDHESLCHDCEAICHPADKDGSHHEKWCIDYTPSESQIAAYVDPYGAEWR